MSCVTCHMSCVICHVPYVSFFFFNIMILFCARCLFSHVCIQIVPVCEIHKPCYTVLYTIQSRVAALTALAWFLAVTARISYYCSLRRLWSLLTRHFSLSCPLCGPIAMGPPFLGVSPRTAEAGLGSSRPM